MQERLQSRRSFSIEMDRRRFVRNAALGSAALVSGPAGCNAPSEPPKTEEAVTKTEDWARPFELDEATVGDLQERMKSGRYSASSIVELYIKRIGVMDKKGPNLHSIIEINPDALKIADDLDRERKDKGPRGPLHGIPVLLKDNVNTFDRMTTTAGSLALLGSIPARDSFIAGKLREAGAILLGKANMSEWANIRSTVSVSGWSARGGQCRNPYALDRSTSGSSSGSAAATAANFCAVSIGTETDGSIVSPATTNGIVGIKPTVGLVSRAGIIPIAHSQDTAGPMCRTVTDAAILLSAIVGVDSRDPATAAGGVKSPVDYTQFLDSNGLKGARLGVVRTLAGFNTRIDGIFADAIDAMKRAGAEIIDPVDFPSPHMVEDGELDVLLYELKSDLNAYFADLGDKAPVRSLKEVIEFNEKNKDKEMPLFGQELFLKAQEKGPLMDKRYVTALTRNQKLMREGGIGRAIREHKLDALIAPTGPVAWLIDTVNGDFSPGMTSTPAAVAGYPHITVPAGFVQNVLPAGISFFGNAWSEGTLIRLAFAYEQATKHRRAPRFLPTAGA